MKIKDLRKLTKEKLIERLDKVRGEVVEMSFDINTGEEKDYSQLGKKRKEIARILTLLKQDNAPVEEKKAEKKTESKKEANEDKKEDKNDKKDKKEKKENK